MPPAALVASITVRAPGASTRMTGAMTPVDVSFCGQAYVSMPSTISTWARVPAADEITCGAARCGAALAAANLEPNSPKVRFSARWATSE